MSLPLILAGPILRRVDKDGVSVFPALSRSATVALSVWADQQTSSGPGTVASGKSAIAAGSAQTIKSLFSTGLELFFEKLLKWDVPLDHLYGWIPVPSSVTPLADDARTDPAELGRAAGNGA